MVNLTAINRITAFIAGQHIKSMKPWSQRYREYSACNRSWYLKKLIKQIRHVLDVISGNDIIEMLKGIRKVLCK